MDAGKPDERYSAPHSADTEFESGSNGRVLRNRLGMRTRRDVGLAEFALLYGVQELYLAQRISPSTTIDVALIRQMHKDWLGSLNPWAGSFLTVNVSKGGFAWPPAHRVPDLMSELERNTLSKLTPCSAGTVEQVARSLAIVHGELLLVHPFRDGNGRISRWVADLMAAQAGFKPLAYRFAKNGSAARRARYIAGDKRA